MASNTERQQAYRERMEAKGFTTVSGLVPKEQAGSIRALLRLIQENPNLEIATLRDRATGRMVKAP